MQRKSSYKPLLFTTTIRNPERLKWFLRVLKIHDEQILDDALAEKIAGEIIAAGLYRPRNLSTSVKQKIKDKAPLTDQEITKILNDNPQRHKEAGFAYGWPSRFDTWFKFAKEIGFVFYQSGKEIKFSKIGLKLIDEEYPEFEQQAFLNAFVKYQSNNPFRRKLNENIPLVLLLQVIKKLNGDDELSNAGISKLELPLVIYWKNSDAEALYQRIKKIRQDFKYSPSSEVIIEICQQEIMKGEDIVRSNKSIVGDYPDEFIRKMRLTGLISLRGGGRFIDFNKNEQQKIDYVLNNYSDYEKCSTEESYFKYISTVDKHLFSFKPKKVSSSERNKFLVKWVGIYTWDKIKEEMLNLSGKRLTKDDTLKYLSAPVRLEFLTTLAIKSKFPKVTVIPNYPVDDEGLPTSTAPGSGNTGDIECFENSNGILIEVTMSEGRMQTMMEVWPISRHLTKFGKEMSNSMCYFIAPSIFTDSLKQIAFVKNEDNLFISPWTIKEFLKYIESRNILYYKM